MQFPCAAFLLKSKKLPFKSLGYYFNLRLQSEKQTIKSDMKSRSNIDILCSILIACFSFKSHKKSAAKTFTETEVHFASLFVYNKIAVKVQGCNAILAQLSKSATTTVTVAEYFMEHYPKVWENLDHPKLRQFFRLKIEELTLHYHAIVAVFSMFYYARQIYEAT